MEILRYNNEEVNQEETAIIDESSILSISWIHDGLDLEMAIDWNGQHGTKYRDKKLKTFLVFKWVSGLKINLDWGKYLQSPTITTFSWQKLRDKTFSIKFKLDFNADGYICFNCNSFYFEIQELSEHDTDR